jgi:thymidylate kinase
MAKLIIFEGIERCGKGSMIDILHGKHGIKKLEPKPKQPVTIPFEHLGILYEGVHQFAAQFYKIVDDTFLVDRYFLSEFVYAKQFKRNSYMTMEYIKDLCDNNEVIVFYLQNTYEDYVERGPKNLKILSEDDYNYMIELFGQYIDLINDNIGNITFHEINTHKRSVQEVYNIVKEKI